jgi:hypothetical protein
MTKTCECGREVREWDGADDHVCLLPGRVAKLRAWAKKYMADGGLLLDEEYVARDILKSVLRIINGEEP